jgi:hypothetical protein
VHGETERESETERERERERERPMYDLQGDLGIGKLEAQER